MVQIMCLVVMLYSNNATSKVRMMNLDVKMPQLRYIWYIYLRLTCLEVKMQETTITHINSGTNLSPLIINVVCKYLRVSWHKLWCCYSANMLQHWTGGEGKGWFISGNWIIPEFPETSAGIGLVSTMYVGYCHKIWYIKLTVIWFSSKF